VATSSVSAAHAVLLLWHAISAFSAAASDAFAAQSILNGCSASSAAQAQVSPACASWPWSSCCALAKPPNANVDEMMPQAAHFMKRSIVVGVLRGWRGGALAGATAAGA